MDQWTLHQPGVYNDLDIFWASLAKFLEPFEWVEADDGYLGEAPLRVKCAASITIPEERKKMMSWVRSHQETVNKCFKQWRISTQVYRHDLACHQDFFAAICAVTQLDIRNGKPLLKCTR